MLNKLMMDDGSALPSEETFLVKNDFSDYANVAIIVPDGVKVLKVVLTVEDSGDDESSSTIAWVFHVNNSWANGNAGRNTTVTTAYVGVTPNKNYTLTKIVYAYISGGAKYTISYSASINKQTPTVTDY